MPKQIKRTGQPPAELYDSNLFYREFAIDSRALDKESREIMLSFSSEVGVRRWGETEYLAHGSQNVDLHRIRAMGAVLMNHNPGIIIGSILSAAINDNRKGEALIRFDDDEDGDKAMSKVASGSLRGVSVGYIIHKYKKLEADDEWNGFRGPGYVATRWEPIEVSLTPIPADSTVGVGRRSLDGIDIEDDGGMQTNLEREEATELEDEKIRELIKSAVGEAVAALPKPVEVTLEEKPDTREVDLKAVYQRASAIGKSDIALKLAAEGKSVNEITSTLLDELSKERGAPSDATAPGEIGGETPPLAVEKMDDDTFIRSICSPALVAAS